VTSSVPVAGFRRRLGQFGYLNEVGLFVGLVAAIQLFPKSIPTGIYALGVAAGCTLAIQAMAVVLVYRSNRIINFAQVQIGATAAAIFTLSVRYLPAVRWTHDVCPVCLLRVSPTMRLANYWLSMLLAVALAVALSLLIYRFVVRRFARAPRLVLTVATIFVAQGLPLLIQLAGTLMTTSQDRLQALRVNGAVPLPFDWSVTLSPVVLHAYHFLALAIAVMAAAGLYVYLRRSATGTAIRAAAENPDRADTLGINVVSVTSRVWAIAGLLSVLAAMLTTAEFGPSTNSTIDPSQLVEILAVAVVARLNNFPLAVLASIALGVLQQASLWAFDSSAPFQGSVVLVIAAALLLQRYRPSRAEVEAGGWDATREIRPIPRELRRLPAVAKNLRILLVVGLVLVLGLPWVLSPAQVELSAVVLITAMVGLSLLLLTGWSGQISLGQFAFAAIGAYVAAVSHAPFVVAVLLGAVAGTAAAVLVGIPALKLRGLHLAVMTLALALAVNAILLDPSYLGSILPTALKRPSLLGVSFESQRVYYYLTLAVLVLTIIAVVGLRRSRVGRVLIAARDNDRAVQAFGVSLTRARLTAFAVAGFIAALAGALFAYQQHGVVRASFAPAQSLNVFLYTAIGGLGSVSGPLIGAAVYGITLVFGAAPWVNELLTGIGGLLLLLVFPGGLGRLVFETRDAVLRRIADRNRLLVPSLASDRRPSRFDRRIQMSQKRSASGSTAFVPSRYTLDRQWALRIADAIVVPGTVGRTAADEVATTDGEFVGLVAQDGAVDQDRTEAASV
jgi:branched-chain amino acid transport system permease protein